MTRKFTNSQSNNKKHNGGGSYNNSSQKNNKISKQTKKDNKPNQPVSSKPQQQPNVSVQKVSAPIVPPPPSKPLTQAGKNNLAKLASINSKLMGMPSSTANTVNTSAPTNPISTNKPIQSTATMSIYSTPNPNLKSSIKKPSAQQVSQAVECLKDLQKLLDSYQQLEMDQKCNLKGFLEFVESKKVGESNGQN